MAPWPGVNAAAPALLVLFFFLFPFANALLDWLSWIVSRWLGRRLQRVNEASSNAHGGIRRWGVFLRHAGADLAAAVALLWLLAWTIPLTVDLYNGLYVRLGRPEPLPLRGYLCAAAKAPWTDGLWIILMLVSTLVPTAWHLAALVMSPIAYRLRPSGPLALDALTAGRGPVPMEFAPGLAEPVPDYETETNARDAAIHRLAYYLVVTRPFAWFVGGVAGAGLIGLVVWGFYLFTGSLPALMLWDAYGIAPDACPGGGVLV